MTTLSKPVVLITGCSSGIGAALAEEFHARGYQVYATARQVESLATLVSCGMHALTLDVTDPASIAAAVATVARDTGRLDILVNNAGYGQGGAVLDLSADALRRQFETNVIAPVQVARAFMPLMLARRRGRIVNVGSISGIVTTPFAGAYCASKAALHALSDAMRLELAPFGIDVVTVQPGKVVSKGLETAGRMLCLPQDSIYQSFTEGMQRRVKFSREGAMPTRDYARQAVTKILADPAPATVRGGPLSLRLPLLQRLLPTRVFDGRLRKMFGLATAPKS
jgi:NAD(P)-dependent dehydrogenase (short-subunit alcohol dehydrogenase family)